ncbi:hypothetical protein [Streptomyces sp. x-80]|uniref:hypothetical protein n=1 Tax=Streptomyces sp. x-80 TaxID=2789282 RepID=UPI0039818A4D
MLTPAVHVRWARCPGGTALLNLRSGEWRMFSGLGARIWDAIALYGSVEGESAVPVNGDVAATGAAINAYVEQLRAMGLLAEPARRRRFQWGRRR